MSRLLSVGCVLGLLFIPAFAQNAPASLVAPSADTIRSVERGSTEAAIVPAPVATIQEQPSEFQEFVRTSLGHSLPLFGAELFRGVPTTFAPVDRIPVTGSYLVGPGDELVIRAWGQIDIDVTAVVDRNGSIFVPKLGELHVAGLQYQQLQDYVKSSIGRLFRNFDASVTLGQLRSIQIFVVGDARRPGAYTVSSLSTLVNAVFASGGPSVRGSMRHIQLRRAGGAITEFDLYDLLRGDKSHDMVLAPGDVIYIPPVGGLVAVDGAVNTPGIYEMNPGMSMEEVLRIAGGLTSTATEDGATLERIENRNTRKVVEFKLGGDGLRQELSDGDIIRIARISPKFGNAVTLRGNVAHPGRYTFHDGMRLHDLFPSRDSLITDEYWSAQNRLASGPLKAEGNASGELRNEVRHGSAEINWDYALVERLDEKDLSTRLIPFNLGRAVGDPASADNLALQPGDVVTIFSRADLRTPINRQSKLVRLEGEFTAAGVYKAESTETLASLVTRAGGLTGDAFLFGAEFTRESVRTDQQNRLDSLIRETEQNIKVIEDKETAAEDKSRVEQELLSRQVMLNKLKRLKPTGRIVLELTPESYDASRLPELVLEDGDRLFVPYRPSTVSVMGSVYNESSFIYKVGKTAEQYLQTAGGPTREADRARMYVIHADGSVVNRERSGGLLRSGLPALKLLPGDTVVLPVKVEHGSFVRGLKDWSQIISQFALGAAAVRVLEGN